MFPCSYAGCSYRSKLSGNARAHERTVHSDSKPFVCLQEDCAFKTKRACDLKKHQVIHQGREKKSIKCPECSIEFSSSYILKSHRISVHGKSQLLLKCHFCPRSFIYQSRLQLHLNIHTGEKPYKCEYCSFSASDKSSLSRHEARHLKTSRDLECSFKGCSYKARFPWIMKKHVLNRHTAAVPTYKCELCSKSYKYPQTLALHIAKHTAETTFQCSQCPFRTQYKGSLTNHLNKIHKIWNFKKFRQFRCRLCNFCGFTGDVVQHFAQKHTKEDQKPFGCYHQNCGYTSANSSALVEHERVHEHNETTQCRICGRKFALARNLKRHLRQEHPGELRFQCDQFEFTFDPFSQLLTHEQQHAKEKTSTRIGGQMARTCKRAGSKFRSHMQDLHPGKRAFKCSECECTDNCYSEITKHARSVKNHIPCGSTQPISMSAKSMRIEEDIGARRSPRLSPCSVTLSRIAVVR